ncbi:MAG: polysaccharide biosynthesis tyrosine autokinase [Candidatus Abyssobacteria bacterium SURF_17]|uniref:non-specific protein-tyrosine kinase n=1 Tax=Candidatus Abyssobacteria bacterium SURF_17 TaxID=2093361 RepID=A0A419F215_9BACT|nr:MAG: polysaccharide biosynthesis tyrosine autokinase [Candidatus Abyssubacteria bacterium SURF_17]
MSKIERALRKAEEEKLKKTPVEQPADDSEDAVLSIPRDTSRPAEQLPALTHLSESFRKIAARVKSCCENLGANDVIFTSAISGEGKTTTAANCALSLCRDFNLSVCLVDCDLRNPTVAEYFGLNGEAGIVEVLRGQAEIPSAIQQTSQKHLSVIQSRHVGTLSLQLLNEDRMRKLTHELRDRFDFVIYDAPPVLPVADTAVLSKVVSTVVLVLEAGRTRRKHVEQIFEQIDRNKIIGFVMNYKRHRMPETYNYSKYYNYGIDETKPSDGAPAGDKRNLSKGTTYEGQR